MGVSDDRTVHLKPGTFGQYRGKDVEIAGVLAPNKLLLLDRSRMETHSASASDFKLNSNASDVDRPAIHDDSPDWEIAEERFAIIEPLVRSGLKRLYLHHVKARAELAGVHFTTVYHWMKLYWNDGAISGLVPKRKIRGNRGRHLDPIADAIVKQTIDELYLTGQQRTVASVYRSIKEVCAAAKVTCPQYNTVRNRINSIPKRELLSKRSRKKEAADGFDLRPGSLKVDRPWQLIEIDATPGDLILVDELHRKPIGRPNIMIAIDVYSRMIVGFYVSLEAESASSAGLCLSQAMLPKEKWLAERDITGNWPCFGRPATIHADNGLAFASKMLRRACAEYRVSLQFRPLRTPQFGAHVEAFNKTLARKIHELPGTTFFDVGHRAEYPSEKLASLTLAEFEKWLTETILCYHEELHSGIQSSPISRYNEAYVLRNDALSSATPETFVDEERLRIDFMPFVEQTIQKYGVQIFKLRFSHPILRPFVNAHSPESKYAKHKFRFHYDPRDISHIYFYHPELHRYVPIPNKNIANPRMSLWEWQFAAKEVAESGRSKIDERAIVEHMMKRRVIETAAAQKTKTARRNSERFRGAGRAIAPLSLVSSPPLRQAERVDDERRIMRPYAVEDF